MMTAILGNASALRVKTLPPSPIAPRFGAAGDGQIEILPEETAASDEIVKGVRGFTTLLQGKRITAQAYERVMRQFVDHIHLCQTNLGSLRFYHTMNQDLIQKQGLIGPAAAPITSPQTLQSLQGWEAEWTRWIEDPEKMGQGFDAASRDILNALIRAWKQMVRLTEQFPNQHNYDDFRRGMMGIAQMLKELRTV